MSNVILHKHLLERLWQRTDAKSLYDKNEFIRLEFNRLKVLSNSKISSVTDNFSKENKYVIQDKLCKIVYYRDFKWNFIILTYIKKDLWKSFKIKKRKLINNTI